MPKEYLRFDEIEDVLSSLDLLALVVPLTDKQPSYWKWVIIAAHGGLQGAMVCALRDTSNVSVLEKRCASEMLKWFDTQKGYPPEERLADFNTLFARCRKPKQMDGQPLNLSPAQVDDIKRLHEHLRNNFAHFTPKGWSIERAGLPRIIRTTVNSIESLMGHSRLSHKLSGNKKRRLAQRLATTKERLR